MTTITRDMPDLRLVRRPVQVTAAGPPQPESLMASLHGDTEALIASLVDAVVQAADEQAAEVLRRASTKAHEAIALANRIHEAGHIAHG